MRKKILPLIVIIFASVLLFGACQGPCSKYEALSCKDPGSQMCQNAKAAVKSMTKEECEKGVLGLESTQAFEFDDEMNEPAPDKAK